MRDIFNRRTDVFGGTFSADEAHISFPNVAAEGDFAGDVGLLIQDLQATYMQQVTRLYEVGRPAIYYVGGRTAGDAVVNRVVGPRTIQQAFYAKFGDVCQARTNTLQFAIQSGCGQDEGGDGFSGYAEYSCYFCVITSIGLGVRAADMLINENLRLMFSSFEYSSDVGAAEAAADAAAAVALV